MKIIERIYQYIDYKNIKPKPFESQTGLSNGYLGKQLKRNADLGEGILLKIIENCPDINIEWLLTGKGDMLKNSEDLKEVATDNSTALELIDIQKKLLNYKDEEVIRLKKEILELKSQVEELQDYRRSVAEDYTKLKK